MSTSCCRSSGSGWRSRGATGEVTSTAFDIELPLLLEAVYRKYHYDFRGYAAASLKRRLTPRILLHHPRQGGEQDLLGLTGDHLQHGCLLDLVLGHQLAEYGSLQHREADPETQRHQRQRSRSPRWILQMRVRRPSQRREPDQPQ